MTGCITVVMMGAAFVTGGLVAVSAVSTGGSDVIGRVAAADVLGVSSFVTKPENVFKNTRL